MFRKTTFTATSLKDFTKLYFQIALISLCHRGVVKQTRVLGRF